MKALRDIVRVLRSLAATAKGKKSLYPAFADVSSTTNSYRYDNPNFPHYITEIDNAGGVPVARNIYDDSGRLTKVTDADGNTTQFIHNTTNQVEVSIDRLGRTNTLAYDLRGNVTAATNALGGVTLMAYDGNNNKTNDVMFLNGQPYATNLFAYNGNGLLSFATDALGHSNSVTYNTYGQVTTSTDARGNSGTNFYDGTGSLIAAADPFGNTISNFFSNGHLVGSRDAAGTLTTNYFDSLGNLTAFAALSASGTILSTNSFAYDLNGNRTNSTIWRRVNGSWVGATTTFIYDGQNRVVQTIAPDGGTNTVIYSATGQPLSTTDKVGRTTTYQYDYQDRLVLTTYPDLTTETSAFDAMGNRTNSVDRAGQATTYVYDALNRLMQTIYPDSTSTRTIYDDLGRIKFAVDARGATNAFGYDLADRSVAVTNGWGTSIAITNLYGFDANGNEIYITNTLGQVTTNVFDALNRQVQVLYPDGTKVSVGFDVAGQRVAETNQDGIVTLFGYDGRRLTSVTNAFGKAEQMVTRYDYDEAGNLLRQIDALNRTNTFAYDSFGRRIAHWMPNTNLVEQFGYNLAGTLIYYTNFNGVVVTNQYDIMNRLTNRASVNGYQVSFAYSPTDQRTNMTDVSGTTSYSYDNRDRLQLKTVAWNGGPTISLNYRFDASGNLTNLWSSTSGGVTNVYQFDPLDRLTNVLANGSAAAAYGFDAVGNLQSVRYGNGVTNQFQYDVLNRLTNAVWKLNASTLGSFYYQLGLAGNRTNLSEAVNGTSRTYAWTFDSLYRLKQESLGGGTSGTLSYSFDPVGNRTNRTVSGGLSLTNQAFTFNTNDWLTSDSYDNNGNTTNSSGNFYQFDALNHLTNMNNGTVLITYNGDGSRVKKTVGTTTTYYLLDDQNPSGYMQVLEEWTASGGTTNLSRVYNYGLQLISQRQPSTSTNYFVFDGRGSTRVLTDNGGNVVNAFAFDAYGNLIASNATPQTVYLYGGEQWDPDLGMYYNRARYYQPGTGRFWTMDSHEGNSEDPRSLHRYTYAQDNPIDNSDPSGNDTHHKVAQSLWEGFSDAAKKFFDTPEATVQAVEHDMSSHGGYLRRSRELMDEFLKTKGIAKGAMTEKQAKQLLKFMEKDAFISGFNKAVKNKGPKEVTEWVLKDGYKLLPQALQGRVLKRAAALSIKNGWLKSVAKKGTGPFLAIGFAVLTAEEMHAQGASDHDIAKAVVDDFYFGVPGMLEAGTDAAWDEANNIALQVRNGAFSYLDYDPESDKYDGSNGLLTSEQAVDAIIRRQDNGGGTIKAGDLTGWDW